VLKSVFREFPFSSHDVVSCYIYGAKVRNALVLREISAKKNDRSEGRPLGFICVLGEEGVHYMWCTPLCTYARGFS